MEKIHQLLNDIYLNPTNPSSFGSVDKLLRAGRKKIKNLTRQQVEDYLSGQDTYTLHRSVKRNFKRIPTYADEVDSVWQMDTADVRHLARFNDGIKYLLIIIDVISRFAFVVPLKNKSAGKVAESFRVILSKYKRSPRVVVSDPGLEFRGTFTEYCKKSKILQILLRVEQKAPLAERFIRTLKEKMVKFMTFNQSKSYVHVIADLVRGYNNTVHRTIKMKPIDVNKDNQNEVKETLYGHVDQRDVINKHAIGDLVRMVKKLKALEKGTTQTTTDEVFIIKSVDLSHSPRVLYHLTDIYGDDIKGRFYEEELIKVKKVDDPASYMRPGPQRVKKTIRRTQVFQTFKGWPKKFDVKVSNKRK